MRSYLGQMFVFIACSCVMLAIWTGFGYALTVESETPQFSLLLWTFGYLLAAVVLSAIGVTMWVSRGERRAVRLLETMDQRPAPLIPKRSPQPQDEAHSARKE